jgi:hypothetical protein
MVSIVEERKDKKKVCRIVFATEAKQWQLAVSDCGQ